MNQPNHVYDRSRKFAAVPHDVIEEIKDARALALYVILKKFADWQTGEAHPSRTTLAKMMGYTSVKPVDTALEVLRGAGVVTTFPRWRDDDGVIHLEPAEGRSQWTNGYIIHDVPATREMETPTPVVDTPHAPQGTGVYPTGDTPHIPQGIGPISHRAHKQEPDNKNQITTYNPPNPPEGGTGREPAEVDTPPTPKPKTDTRGTFLPEGWQPQRATVEKLATEFPHLGVDGLKAIWEEFSDYWAGVPGAKGRKRDWEATFRNWVRRSARDHRNPRNQGYNAPTRARVKLDGWKQAADELSALRAQQAGNIGIQGELGR